MNLEIQVKNACFHIVSLGVFFIFIINKYKKTETSKRRLLLISTDADHHSFT